MKPDIRDVHVYGGLVMAAVGIGCIYWPAGLVAFGVAMAYLGITRG